MSCYISFYVNKESFEITEENEMKIMEDSICVRSINQRSDVGNTIGNYFSYDKLEVLDRNKIKDIKNELNGSMISLEQKISQMDKITISNIEDFEEYFSAKEEYKAELYYLVELNGFFDMLDEMIICDNYNIYVCVG